jgi:hypothetical protein
MRDSISRIQRLVARIACGPFASSRETSASTSASSDTASTQWVASPRASAVGPSRSSFDIMSARAAGPMRERSDGTLTAGEMPMRWTG